jgi:hypothetical protein
LGVCTELKCHLPKQITGIIHKKQIADPRPSPNYAM